MIELNSNTNGQYSCPSTMTQSKGLVNFPGQNNCFLNCAVQVGGFVQKQNELSFFLKLFVLNKIFFYFKILSIIKLKFKEIEEKN